MSSWQAHVAKATFCEEEAKNYRNVTVYESFDLQDSLGELALRKITQKISTLHNQDLIEPFLIIFKDYT